MSRGFGEVAGWTQHVRVCSEGGQEQDEGGRCVEGGVSRAQQGAHLCSRGWKRGYPGGVVTWELVGTW